MKEKFILWAALLGSLLISHSATAGSFDGLKDKLAEKVVKKANADKKRVAPNQDNHAPSAGSVPQSSHAGLEYAPESLVKFIQCAGLELTNVMIGEYGNYYFQQGFKKEKRSGFINRKPVQVTYGCVLPNLQPRQFAYLEVDAKEYESMGSSNDWEMQCVKSADPVAGAVSEQEGVSESPYKVDYLAGKDLLLHCGNDQGIEECATGSNSSRSGEWEKKLEQRGKTMLSVTATTSTLAPPQGEKLFCHYYNKNSGKSLFAFEYLRTRG